MRRRSIVTVALALGLVSAGVLGGCGADDNSGSFSFLTYNVAGLPEGLSGSDPVRNIPQISPLLNNYDLVVVQEDFAYPQQLRADVEHPYQSEHLKNGPGKVLGDGLDRFSRFAFADHTREAWQTCHGTVDNGSDCLAAKGFAHARTTFAAGVEVDVYNLHFDAGRSGKNYEARQTQMQQLVDAIERESSGQALIVAGDFNMHVPSHNDENALLAQLFALGLVDAFRKLNCGDERIDRVLLRSGGDVELTPLSWAVDQRFVDASGADLSDHKAVAARVAWQRQ
jgi:endonuclease/exonuclease/phosphatase family metal-dependent hydrolase